MEITRQKKKHDVSRRGGKNNFLRQMLVATALLMLSKPPGCLAWQTTTSSTYNRRTKRFSSTPFVAERRRRRTATTELFLIAPAKNGKVNGASFNGAVINGEVNGRVNGGGAVSDGSSAMEKMPFLIEQLPAKPNRGIYLEIAKMCIKAFFHDEEGTSFVPFYREWQLSSLRKMQTADLAKRRCYNPNGNMMFVAWSVEPADEAAHRRKPLLLDWRGVHNAPPPPPAAAAADHQSQPDFVRGQVLGFVEVTVRPYGVGGGGSNERGTVITRAEDDQQRRPVLTNLSVKREARGLGVGSALVQTCERRVRQQWNMHEILLEVEEDNETACNFYRRRGYEILFTDPASRRYDTTGLFLREVRCKRHVMRKELTPLQTWQDQAALQGMNLFERIRDKMFAKL
jgi:ribosomal protein S18 acetylase RimI-like enzyme